MFDAAIDAQEEREEALMPSHQERREPLPNGYQFGDAAYCGDPRVVQAAVDVLLEHSWRKREVYRFADVLVPINDTWPTAYDRPCNVCGSDDHSWCGTVQIDVEGVLV